MDGRAIGEAIVKGFLIITAAAFVLGGLAVWGLPKLWGLVKPWIHALTS